MIGSTQAPPNYASLTPDEIREINLFPDTVMEYWNEFVAKCMKARNDDRREVHNLKLAVQLGTMRFMFESFPWHLAADHPVMAKFYEETHTAQKERAAREAPKA